VIDTDAKLAAYLPTLKSATWLALDTEADSLHAYPEKVCLIQISTTAGDELIDPLANTNLDPLLDALAGHELIMHGADYDLRLFRKHHEFVPRAIFDTMLAARLLGERHFGLSSLAEKFLGVKLDKASQKADWARRPLTERMETYARNDTHHLKPLADKLKLELQNKNRLGWHQEACARLIVDCSQPTVVDGDSVWRVKGSHALDRHALAVMRELWHWRNKEALAANRPPFFILSHEKMVELAEAAVGRQAIEPLLPPRMSPHRLGGTAATVWRQPFGPAWRCPPTGTRKKSGIIPPGPRRPRCGVIANWKNAATRTRTSWALTPRSLPAAPHSESWPVIGNDTRRN
jgi:ribonuclease D